MIVWVICTWVFKLEVWNDLYGLRVGFKAWQNGIKVPGYDLIGDLISFRLGINEWCTSLSFNFI